MKDSKKASDTNVMYLTPSFCILAVVLFLMYLIVYRRRYSLESGVMALCVFMTARGSASFEFFQGSF